MSIQNRSVLYKTPEPVLVPEGVYEAELVEVKEFSNAFGNRVGLVFKITCGQHEGVELMESATATARCSSSVASEMGSGAVASGWWGATT